MCPALGSSPGTRSHRAKFLDLPSKPWPSRGFFFALFSVPFPAPKTFSCSGLPPFFQHRLASPAPTSPRLLLSFSPLSSLHNFGLFPAPSPIPPGFLSLPCCTFSFVVHPAFLWHAFPLFFLSGISCASHLPGFPFQPYFIRPHKMPFPCPP